MKYLFLGTIILNSLICFSQSQTFSLTNNNSTTNLQVSQTSQYEMSVSAYGDLSSTSEWFQITINGTLLSVNGVNQFRPYSSWDDCTLRNVFSGFDISSYINSGNLQISIFPSWEINYDPCFNGIELYVEFELNKLCNSAYLTPNIAEQNEQIIVEISGCGNNIGFYDYTNTQYSALQFIHSDYSNTGSSFYGSIFESSQDIAQASVNIPMTSSLGYYDVQFFDYNSNEDIIIEDGFQLNVPSFINELTPNSATIGEELQVEISGTNITFISYSGEYDFNVLFTHSDYSNTGSSFIGDNLSHSSNVLTTQVNVPLSADSGPYDVEVYNYDNNSWEVLENGFEVQTVDLIGYSPSNVLVNEGFSLSIIGENTQWLSSSPSNVLLSKSGNTIAGSFTVYSNTLIIANFNGITNYGEYDIDVYDQNLNSWISISGFDVLPNPQITNVTPNIAYPGQTLDVSISGQGSQFTYSFEAYTGSFIFQSSNNNVKITNDSYSVNSSQITHSQSSASYTNLSNVTFSIPTYFDVGNYDIEVYDYALQDWVVYENSVTIFPAPEIYSIEPSLAVQGSSVSLLISHNDIDVSSIYLSKDGVDIAATSWNNIDSSTIEVEFNIPLLSSLGLWSLVINENQFSSYAILENSFEVTASPPTISLINPSEINVGETVSVTISGINSDFLDYSSLQSNFYLTNGENSVYATNSVVYNEEIIIGNISIPDDLDYVGDYDLIVYSDNYEIHTENAIEIINCKEYTFEFDFRYYQNLTISDLLGNTIYNTTFYSYNECNSSLCNDHQIELCLDDNACYEVNTYNDWGYSYDFKIRDDLNQIQHQVYTYSPNSHSFCIGDASLPVSINSIYPQDSDLGSNLSVVITGSNIDFYDYSSSQYSSLQFVHSDYSNSSSSFTGNIYSSGSEIAYAQLSIPSNIDEGYYDVEIFDLGSENWIILENGFYLEQGPMIESISPNEGYQGESLEVNISGLNMSFEDYSGSYSHLGFYHSDYSNTNYSFWGGYAYYLSDNEAWFNVNIPSEAPEGMYDVRVYDYNSNNYVWLYDGFEVLETLPTINYISPNGGDLGTQLNVYISGSDFDFYDYSSSQYSSLQFVHSDYSNSSSSFTGNIYSSGSGYAYAQLSITSNIDEGYYDVEIFDLGSENWIILENGFYLEQGPMIESISPNEGYQGESLEVNISGLNMSFEDYSGSYSHLGFYHSDYSNTNYSFWGGYAYDLSDNEAWFNVNIPSEAPEGMYDVRVYDYNSNNYVWLYDGFEVLVNNDPCAFWNIENVTYWNENSSLFYEFDDDSDTINIELCPGVQIFYANPSSIQNTQFLYWNNDVVFENNFSEIFIENDTILSIYYDDGDTSCLVKTYNFNVFESVQDVAEVSVTNNSCFGIDDGQITLTSQERFNSFYYESNFFFIDNQDILNLIPYLDIDSYSLYEDTFIVNNPNNISEIYFSDLWNSNNGCFLDFNFDTELPQANYYILPFEESFDSGMPCDWNNDSHWSFGNVSDVLGPYWDIPAHNQFAVSNDDACDCDMMQDRLITPPLIIDNLEGDISLSFSAFFTGDYGSIANIEISNDMGTSWQNISVLTPSNDWQDLSFNISDYITSETIQLAFRHSDSHSWGSGFAIDDVFVDFQCLDSDNDEVCDFDEVLGCTDVLANNFDELATEDDGSCLIDVYGCTYAAAINFNSEANIDDGSCYFTLNGCTDPFAINFNDLANIDDGSCEYSSIDDNPCDIVPSGLSVDNIIHNRVTFNWSAPTAAPSHYMIRYRVAGTSSWTVMTAGPINSNAFTGTSRTRYFMEPGTTYEWGIRARVLNEDGSTNCQSSWSASSEYTTLDACANLENLSASTEAVWATLSADAPAAEWGVWQSKGKMRVVGTNSYRYVNGDSNGNISVLKGNFTASSDYEWHTKAWCTGNVDANGDSDPQYHSGWGEFSTFSTQDPCDKMPTNLSTSSNGANTAITMSWDTPESGAPDHYFLQLTKLTTGQVWEWNNISGSDNSKTKFGLTAGEYSWKIRGACGTSGTSWATIFSSSVEYTLGGARLESDIVSNLNIYPNPTRDIFNISFSSKEIQSIIIKVVNVVGEEIFNEELFDFNGSYSYELKMTDKPKGVYFLEISSDKGNVNSKMVLQ